MYRFIVSLVVAVMVFVVPPAAAQNVGPPSGKLKAAKNQSKPKQPIEPPTVQESTPSQEPTTSPEKKAEEVGPAVVTATKTELPISVSPFSTETITGEAIEERQVPTVEEALRTARGLHVVRQGRVGSQTSVFVRGGESDHNLVLLDGIPFNESGGLFDFSNLTSDNIERIEILRGAGSALYGSDAMTSVIQVITKEGDGPPTLRLYSAFGDQGTTREMASLQGSRPGARYSFTLSRYDTDGFEEPNDFYGNTTARGKVSLALTDYSNATFTAHYADQRKGLPNQTGLYVFDRDEVSEGDELALSLKLSQQVLDWLDHSVFIAVMDRRRLARDLIDDAGVARRPEASVIQAAAFDTIFERSDEIQRRLADYHFNITLAEGNIITGGLEWEMEEGEIIFATPVSFFSSPSEFFPFVEFNDERRNMGYYVQGQFNWQNRLIIVPGVRFEDNQVFGGETVPRVAAAFILGGPAEKSWVGPLKLKGSWGVGIKEPQFEESFSPPPFAGNPGLAPERTKHWDTGAELTLCKGRCYIEAVYFHVVQKDRISFVVESFFPFSGRFENIGRARSEGVEFYASVEPWRWLKLEGQYTWLEGVIKQAVDPDNDVSGVGKELLRRPKHSGSGSVVGLFGPFMIRGDVIIVGDRFDSDFRGLEIFDNPGYQRVDLAARLRLDNQIVKLWGAPFPHSVEAFGRVENLFDQNYEEVLGVPAPGINFLAGFQVTFQGAEQKLTGSPEKKTLAQQ